MQKLFMMSGTDALLGSFSKVLVCLCIVCVRMFLGKLWWLSEMLWPLPGFTSFCFGIVCCIVCCRACVSCTTTLNQKI